MSAVKDKILTIEDIAKLKGVTTEYIRDAIREKKLKATFFHGEWHIRESNYLEYEKNCQNRQHPQKLVTLGKASDILQMSQTIIVRAIRKGYIETYQDDQGLKILIDSLLEWDRKTFDKDRSYPLSRFI